MLLKTGFSQVLRVLEEPKGGTVSKQVNISFIRSLCSGVGRKIALRRFNP